MSAFAVTVPDVLGQARGRTGRVAHRMPGQVVPPPHERPARGVDLHPHLAAGQVTAHRQRGPRVAEPHLNAGLRRLRAQLGQPLQAMAWARAGRAYAKLGDNATARNALTASSRLLNRATNGDAPAWSYWVDESRMAAQAGRALCDLGDHKSGQREIAAVIHSWGNRYPRDRAKLHGYLAISHLRTGDVENACESGRRAVDILAGQVDSDGARRRLRAVEEELAPFKDSSTVEEFMSYARSRLGS